MSDNKTHPAWLPTADETLGPKGQQKSIIDADEYPMRVLAGAGTGKTFTMVRKIEHLINEENVSPDRILALTFTNNAADSIREKLNAKLGTAGYDIDAYTYHSICNEILTDYAYEAGIDPDFEVATDAEQYAVVLEVLDEIEYRSVKPNVYGADSYGSGAASKLLSFIGSMKRSGISPTDVTDFLGSTERVYELGVLPDRIEEIASNHLGGRSIPSVQDALPAVQEELVAERDILNDNGIEGNAKDFLDRLIVLCDRFAECFRTHEADEQALPENAHKLPKYLLGGYSSAPKGIPDDLDLEFTEHLRKFLDDCKAACDLNAGYAAYERELNDRNLLDFDSLVVKAAALMASSTGDEVTKRWDYVFCDEFQDTDRLQFDLVTSLVTDDNLFVVGDDDQAIYEWRGAHVENITSELDDTFGKALADKPLEQNFRSHQPILDLANNALHKLDRRQTEKTLTRVLEPEYSGETVATIRESEDEEDRAAQLVTVVQNLLNGDAEDIEESYSPRDIGLLVRKNNHAIPILDAFEEAGIPYQVAGDLATESVGVGTVAAYLKALAHPEDDEVSWNRVLLMRYRLCDADLQQLNAGDTPLVNTLRKAPLTEFEEPDRIQEVRDHVEKLLSVRDSSSLARLYRELKKTTDIEWYLTAQEKRDLTQLDQIIEQYGADTVQPSLCSDFIESLQYYDSLFDESSSTPTSQPEVAEDAVNVMTIHKSKGLDFPVVLIPRLVSSEWAPSARSYDALETALSTSDETAWSDDFLVRDARETRRILHVGLTRAEDVLVLQGATADDEGGENQTIYDAVSKILPDEIPWMPGRGQLPIWEDILESLPVEAVDWTETLAMSVVGESGGRIEYQSNTLSPAEARERVLSVGTQAVEGTIGTQPSDPTLALDSLSVPSEPLPALQHSYSSLNTFETCSRKHYLDYVVKAFDDYQSSDRDEYEGVSQRTIGNLFHDTAELAATREHCEKEDWIEICSRLATQRQVENAIEKAVAAIDRFFQTGLQKWELLDAEREFELTLNGHTITGFIDAVYRKPTGERIVIDYKATTRERDIDMDKQLPIYLLACRDLYDDRITQAGYAYVGSIGPRIDSREFVDEELEAIRSNIVASMEQIGDWSFEQYQVGEHCQWCSHNQLPCGQERNLQ